MPGRYGSPIPKINKIPSMRPIIPPIRTSSEPIFFKSDNLTISPCYNIVCPEMGLHNNSKTTIYNIRNVYALVQNRTKCAISGDMNVNSKEW